MRLEQLQYLLGIEENGSIIKTAEKYYISPQAVSKAIKSLERECGIILLERSPKSVVLSPAGIQACKFAKAVLQEYEAFCQSVAVYKNIEDEKAQDIDFSIYTIPRFISPVLFSLVKKMKQKNPRLHVNIRNRSVRQILEHDNLQNAEVGLIAFAGYIPKNVTEQLDSKNLQYHILKEVEYHICVHRSMPLAKQAYVTQKELNHYAYIAFCNDFYEEDIETAEYKIDSFEQQRNLLQQGNCYARCTEKEFDLFFKKGFVKLCQSDAVPMYFLAVYNMDRLPVVDTFIDAFAELL